MLPPASPGFSRLATVPETDVMKECKSRSESVRCAARWHDTWFAGRLANRRSLAAVCRAGLMAGPAFAVAALAACARPDNATISIAPGMLVYYACEATDQTPHTGSEDSIPPVSWNHRVAIRYGADDQPAALSVDGSSDNYLEKKSENNETIYINNAYAWKPDGAGGIMIDVTNVLRFRCNVSDRGSEAALND